MIGKTISHYRILSKLGEGGMGEVYRAHDERLDRDVAIKVLPEAVTQDAERLARFDTEAKAVAKLAHPNILEVYELGDHEGRPFMATELLEGETLRERLEGGSLGWQKATEIGAAIADGLGAAHEVGIIHRDLKPSNVFLTADGRAKVLDFGLAKYEDAGAGKDVTQAPTITRHTDPGTVLGTVGYMSPEQVRGETVDQRSDIFSLGCVLYEMVSGQRAFTGDSAVETMNAILKEEPSDVSSSGVEQPPELAGTIRRCIEKSPQARFQSASDLAYNLRSITTQTAGLGARPKPAAKTRRWLASGGLAIVVAIVAVWQLPLRENSLPPEVEKPRIVVLPFENLGLPEDEYFADGLTSEIINRLAAVSALEVISRTTAMRYKNTDSTIPQIGEELNVGYVLEGSIRWDRSGSDHGRVRITPQLIRVADDSHLWSERYDRVLEDIFTVQSDIAEGVIAQLEATLLEKERRVIEAQPTQNMEAYQAYLLGAQYLKLQEEDRYLLLAVEMLERAVQLDPEFAVAHAKLCRAHANLYNSRQDYTPERLAKAKASVDRAFALQPGLPEGHRALGWYYYHGFRDYERAQEEFALAAELLPNDESVLEGLSYTYRRQGRWEEALQGLNRVLEMSPQNPDPAVEVAWTHVLLRQYERAEKEFRRLIATAPDNSDGYSNLAANYLMWDGTTERARRILESAPELDSQWILYYSVMLDVYDRRPESAMARLLEAGTDGIDIQNHFLPTDLFECMRLSEMGQEVAGKTACGSAVAVLKREIELRPHDHRLYSAIGHAYALLGQTQDAVAAGEYATELVPISKDAMDGADRLIELAKIYTRVGEADRALDLIDKLLMMPCELSVGLLRLDPVWDPLRDNPRFQAPLKKHEIE
jgi:serine/threonine protein kinase/Flp pilus assembly protein TadD